MELTEEQKERIRKNRERALELQRQAKERKEKREREENIARRAAIGDERNSKRSKSEKKDDTEVELEDFEVSASDFVTKKEAKEIYCLPDGTLAVCKYVEKENPHRKGWTPMKLYYRNEIRSRARERYGGLEGLQTERKKRVEKRFMNDLEKTRDVFRES
jgi:DNA-repair protein complementing XP-A cells